MNAGKVVAVTLLAAGISVGTAVFSERWLAHLQSRPPGSPGGADQLQTLPDFRLPDLKGREVASSTWAGKILILNYWATWCPPCVREMPLFIRAQDALGKRGVQFVGVAVDRDRDVEAFVARYPVNYPVLIGNPEAVELSRRLGNRLQGLPFTVIFDRRGRRVFSRIGELSAEELGAQLNVLLGDVSAATMSQPASANPPVTGAPTS